MRYKISHTTKYSYSQPVPVCHNQVHLTPRNFSGHVFGRDSGQLMGQPSGQTCDEHRLLIHPSPSDRGRRLDYFGNEVHYFSLQEPHRGLTVTATSLVTVHRISTALAPTAPKTALLAAAESPPWDQLTADLQNSRTKSAFDAYPFIFDSPRIRRRPMLAEYARPSFPTERSIVEAVLDLTSRIYHEFKYDPTATTVQTPIEQVFANRRGVCQDFAHLQIACLRSLGVPARYVSGYLRTQPPPGKPRLVGADASHAWLAVYCGEIGWIDFDPTNNVIPHGDHITLAWGREYDDVCPIQGVFVGGGKHSMTVSVDVQPLD